MREKLSIFLLVIGLGLILTGLFAPFANSTPPRSDTPSASVVHNSKLDAIKARYAETADVVNQVVQGAGEFEIGVGVDGTVTAKRLSGKAPTTINFPAIGPYWSVRWHDAYGGHTVLGIPTHLGHPYVCIDSLQDVESRHFIQTVAQDYDIYDFIVEWSFAGCSSVSSRYNMTTDSGARRDTCNHTYLATETIGGVTYVLRRIVYFDELIMEACFSDAEINTWRTSTAIGVGLGLLWHLGDGAPSPFAYTAGNSPYIWPQDYDRTVLEWYN